MAHRIQLRSRPEHRFAYSGRSVLVTEPGGHVPQRDSFGLYVDNTRLLSRFEVTVDGEAPRLVSASTVGGDGFLAYDEIGDHLGPPGRAVYLERAHFLGDGMRTVLRLRSFADAPRSLVLVESMHGSGAAEHRNHLRRNDIDTSQCVETVLFTTAALSNARVQLMLGRVNMSHTKTEN